MLGLFVARRATGRVATLRDAARRVGEGDLTVRVAPRGSDELDDLGRAFDRMVGELGEARSRLGYMQKVSAWQEVARRLAHEIKNPLTPIQLAVQELGSKYRGGDPAYERLLATAQEILSEEVGAIRRLVDDFSAFAKLPKVEPVPVDLGPGGRGLRARPPGVAGGAAVERPRRRWGALRSDADPPRAGEPGGERRPGRRERRASNPEVRCSVDRTRRAARPASSSTTTAPAWPPTRASGSSTPTSRPRSTAPGWGWPSSARSSSITAATCGSPTSAVAARRRALPGHPAAPRRERHRPPRHA